MVGDDGYEQRCGYESREFHLGVVGGYDGSRRGKREAQHVPSVWASSTHNYKSGMRWSRWVGSS